MRAGHLGSVHVDAGGLLSCLEPIPFRLNRNEALQHDEVSLRWSGVEGAPLPDEERWTEIAPSRFNQNSSRLRLLF
jgi:hypothetical protein